MTVKPRIPAKLGPRGTAFWRAVVDRYDLELDAVQLLVEVVRLLDVMDELAKDVAELGTIVETAAGGAKLNPAVAELRASKAALGRLLAQLGLPDENDATLASPVSAGARRRAERRWNGRPSA